jgi:hypothetical protein
MGDLIAQGKIRGWGLCNDNAFGLTACCEIAKRLGVPPPVSMQNDFSLIDRRYYSFYFRLLCCCVLTLVFIFIICSCTYFLGLNPVRTVFYES